MVSRFAASDLGRERALGLRPFEEEAPLRARRILFEEASRLVGERALVPDFDVPLGDLLTGIATGRPPVEGLDLVRLADLGRATRAAAARIREAVPPTPALDALARELPDIDPLLKKIDRMLDRRGEVREDASPRLTALRRQIRTVRDQIYRDLGEFVSSHKDELSEETIPMRGGRLVVVLQSGARGRSGGLVHGRSATGRELLLRAAAGGGDEQHAAAVGGGRGGGAAAHPGGADRGGAGGAARPAGALADFLGELDLLQASVRFGDRCGAVLPEIGAAATSCGSCAARHPLLDPCLADVREEALGQAGHSGEIVPLRRRAHAPSGGSWWSPAPTPAARRWR